MDTDTEEYGAMVARMIAALTRRCSGDDPDALLLLERLKRQLDDSMIGVITALRLHGFTDRVIGEALGVTQQAVSKRWPR
jgi:hypothetical protein